MIKVSRKLYLPLALAILSIPACAAIAQSTTPTVPPAPAPPVTTGGGPNPTVVTQIILSTILSA